MIRWQEPHHLVRRPILRSALVIAAALVAPGRSLAQDPAVGDEHQHHTDASPSWMWMTDANVFFGYNYQQRKFTDFSAWESQNWFMVEGQHPVGPGVLTLPAMFSLEPFTMQKIGSPQVFQTGETYNMGPLIDYQHPHDFVMQLGGHYRVLRGTVGMHFAGYVVGPPALGPTPSMHRASARDNPQSPLIHHYTDSTHISFGVVTAGVDVQGFTIEASSFKGEEPDEDRLNIDQPKLDSWSARGSWRRGPWYAQVSGAHLHRPEPFELFDMTRFTASIEFDGAFHGRPVAATALWGQNREIHGILDGYLLEWDVRADRHGFFYGRAEAVAKDLLDLGGPDPRGFIEFHRISHIAALTLGYVHDLVERRWGRVGIGGDATAYHVPENMLESYGAPHSFHFFVRYRPSSRTSMAHVH
jgi:hypothetical protein